MSRTKRPMPQSDDPLTWLRQNGRRMGYERQPAPEKVAAALRHVVAGLPDDQRAALRWRHAARSMSPEAACEIAGLSAVPSRELIDAAELAVRLGLMSAFGGRLPKYRLEWVT